MAQGRRQGLGGAGSSDLGRGGSRGSREPMLVTIEVQTLDALVDVGGTNRTR